MAIARFSQAGPAGGRTPDHAQVRALHFAAAGRAILNGIDLSLAVGERLGVIGPNGSGKSTLLRCLYGWHRPSAGAVMLDGVPLQQIASQERAQCIAVLAQERASSLGLTAAARLLLAPLELPLGVMTAAIGGLFFLVMLRRRATLE